MLRAAAWVVAGLLLTATLSAQGIPGTRAHAEGRTGWAALREGRNEAAARAFATAIDLEPRDPSLRFGAAVAAHLLGQPAAARDLLERALRLAPNYTAAAELLGEILYKAGELDAAIQLYEQALGYAPGHERVTRRVSEWRSQASLQREFYRQQSGHFTVLFEGPADEPLANRAIDVLEANYWRIGSTLSSYPEEPVTVVLYTEEQFRDITRSPDWAAAAYDGWIRVPMRGALERPEELERVLSHELTHAFIRAIAPTGVPAWLNEGLAVFFEPDGPGWTRRQLGATNARLDQGRLTSGFAGLSGMRARLAYAQSADTVEKMVELAGAQAIVTLLRDVARGEPFAVAFEQRMLVPLPAFLAELQTRQTGVLR